MSGEIFAVDLDTAGELQAERDHADRLAEALRHTLARDHTHWPEACDGCSGADELLQAHAERRKV